MYAKRIILICMITTHSVVVPMPASDVKVIAAAVWDITKKTWGGSMLMLDDVAIGLKRLVAAAAIVGAGIGVFVLCREYRIWSKTWSFTQEKMTCFYRQCLESRNARSARILEDFLENGVFSDYSTWCKARGGRMPLKCTDSEHKKCSCKDDIGTTKSHYFMSHFAILPYNYDSFERGIKLLESSKKDEYLKKVFDKETIEHICKIRNDQVWINYIIPLAEKDEELRKICQKIVNENPACRFNWFKRLTVNSLAALKKH